MVLKRDVLIAAKKSVGKGVVKSVGKGLGFFKELPKRICRVFRIDGEGGFMVLYACSSELNSVATEVRTGAMKAAGLKPA